jgi:signal transduction histidine kinase
MPRWIGSVRVRTTLAATAAVGAALVLGAFILVTILQRSLVMGVQTTLVVRANDVAVRAALGMPSEQLLPPDQPGVLIQVVDRTGHVVVASARLQGQPPIGPFRSPGRPLVAWSYRLTTDDELYRIVGTSIATPSEAMTIYVAGSLEGASDSVTKVKNELAFGLPLLVLVVAATCWVVVGRALRPVEAIRAQVAEIGSGELGRRVPEPPLRDEVGRLARTMNAMLDRLQDASERQRRFVANASHELRSPLASLRTQIEVAHKYPDAGPRDEERVSGQLAEVARMERLVGDLFLLARADERRFALGAKPVPLHRIVLAETSRPVADDRVFVDTSAVEPTTVVGDGDALARVVRNLLENARRHAQTRVAIGLHSVDGRAELSVADDGPGIPPEARERVFERFTRLDQSRARHSGGAGLGLAIVREILASHGARIRIADRTPGACFIIDFPLNNAPAPGPA